MLWFLIAAICAGVGAVGLVLILQKLRVLPKAKWLWPAAAGMAMLGFQIVQEYSWFQYQIQKLPEGVKVIKVGQSSSPLKPWSYLFPIKNRFMAVKRLEQGAHPQNTQVILADLYVFEPLRPALQIPQVIHCGWYAHKDLIEDLKIPTPGAELDSSWMLLDAQDPLIKEICLSK
jgi:hypothetical protein